MRRIGATALVVAAFHAGTWVGRDAYDFAAQRQSQLRQEFKQEFGFPLRGHPDDLEKVPGLAADIAANLHYEDVPVSAVHVVSPHYVRKPVHRQYASLAQLIRSMREYVESRAESSTQVETEVQAEMSDAPSESSISEPAPHVFASRDRASYGGYVSRVGSLEVNRLEIGGEYPQDALLHELKHAATSRVTAHNPGFRDEWMAAGADKSAFYQPLGIQLALYSTIVRAPQTPEVLEKLQRAGFPGSHASLNWYEDVAEMTTWGELALRQLPDISNPYGGLYVDWLIDCPSEEVTRQVKLAEREGLLPKEFTEGIGLVKQYRNMKYEGTSQFLKSSQSFIEQYPSSKYSIQVHYARGKALWEQAKIAERKGESPWPYQRAAMDEWTRGLMSEKKELVTYRLTLKALQDYAVTIGDGRRAGALEEAVLLHETRHAENDLRLAVRGVNDYLIGKGLL